MNFMHFIQNYGTLGLFVMLALEYVIFVVPGETTLTTVGVLWRDGSSHWHFATLLVAATLGTFTGSMVAYGIGRWLGRPVLAKYGKYVFLTESRLKQSEALFHRQTVVTLIVSRYLPVVRDVIPYIAGINRVKMRIYIPVMLLASMVWTASFIAAGSLIEQALAVVLAHWKIALAPAIVVVVLAFFAYRALHKRLEQKLELPPTVDPNADVPNNTPQ